MADGEENLDGAASRSFTTKRCGVPWLPSGVPTPSVLDAWCIGCHLRDRGIHWNAPSAAITCNLRIVCLGQQSHYITFDITDKKKWQIKKKKVEGEVEEGRERGEINGDGRK